MAHTSPSINRLLRAIAADTDIVSATPNCKPVAQTLRVLYHVICAGMHPYQCIQYLTSQLSATPPHIQLLLRCLIDLVSENATKSIYSQ